MLAAATIAAVGIAPAAAAQGYDRSNHGPDHTSNHSQTFIDFGAKSDLVAGTGIVSLTIPGRSMAAPVVTGTVALMPWADPSIAPIPICAANQGVSTESGGI